MTTVTILLLAIGLCAALYNIIFAMRHREGTNRTCWVVVNLGFVAWIGYQLITNIIKLI